MTIQQKQSNNEFSIKNGQDVARYLVYFSKMNSRWTTKEINIVNISGLGIYRKHKQLCDKALILQDKYGIDLVKYVKFFLSKYRMNDDNIEKLLDIQNVVWYANELQIKAKYQKVYDYIQKSVNNVVNECISGDYVSVKEYLKMLIEENKLGAKYLSGEISGYYLAGIRNLPKLVRKMDRLNRDTLKEVVENQDKLESDMQDAFTYFKMSRISIISYTNDRLNERLINRK